MMNFIDIHPEMVAAIGACGRNMEKVETYISRGVRYLEADLDADINRKISDNYKKVEAGISAWREVIASGRSVTMIELNTPGISILTDVEGSVYKVNFDEKFWERSTPDAEDFYTVTMYWFSTIVCRIQSDFGIDDDSLSEAIHHVGKRLEFHREAHTA
jgi:hypothetical protein